MTPATPTPKHLLEAAKAETGTAARLALADWLDAHGREVADRDRGRLIRLQVEMAELADRLGDYRLLTATPRYKQLEGEVAALLATHRNAWLGPWAEWVPDPRHLDHCFVRGLLRPWVKGLGWLDRLAADADAWDWVDGLTLLSLTAADVERLAASPVLSVLTVLDFGVDGWGDETAFRDAGLEALVTSPHLNRLHTLILGDTGVGPAGMRALAASPLLGRLHTLELQGFDCTTGNSIEDSGARALAEAPAAAGLTRLLLMTADFADAGAAALAASPHLAGLTHLELRGNRIGAAGARAVAASPHLTRLTYLGLDVWSGHHLPGREPPPSQPADEAVAALTARFGAVWRGCRSPSGG
ncbi:MAG: hypothetical protein U0871_15385 [Gemmataceae bacterium]